MKVLVQHDGLQDRSDKHANGEEVAHIIRLGFFGGVAFDESDQLLQKLWLNKRKTVLSKLEELETANYFCYIFSFSQ